MPHFNEKLQVQEHVLTIYFNSVLLPEGKRYCISAIDGKGKTHIFYMREIQGKWVLDKTKIYPDWVMTIEQELGNLIVAQNHYSSKHLP